MLSADMKDACSVLQRTVLCPLFLEGMGHLEVIQRIRLLPRAADQFEQVAVGLIGLRVRRRLDKEDVSGHQYQLSEYLLAADDLHHQVALGALAEMPVQIVVIVEVAVRRARSKNAVRMFLQPSPE